MTRTFFFPLTFAFAGLAAACGSLDGNTDQHTTTLGTMQGEIAKPDNVKLGSGALRVALVWENVSPDGGKAGLRIAQDVAVTPSFPAAFQLALTEPPPAEAMFATKGTPSMRAALGYVVAYEDTNGNGKLDLVDPSNPVPVDHVVGVPFQDVITYLEGDPAALTNGADDVGAHGVLGYNLFEVQPSPDSSCTAAGGSSSCPGFLWKPIATPISITLSNSHAVSTIICGVDPGATRSAPA